MTCEDLILSIIIGVISGILSGFFVNSYLKRQERSKLVLLRERILSDIINDIKIYIQLFNNKPINFNENVEQNNQIELSNKIVRLKKELENIDGLKVQKKNIVISKPVLLQLKLHLNKIVDNEFYFKHNELLNDKQINATIEVIKNIDFYLNIDNSNHDFTGITLTLTSFLKEIVNI